MKHALVTMAFTKDRRKWAEELTFPRMRQYARQYDMDFILLTSTKRSPKLGDIWDWERHDYLYDLLKSYVRILHIEDDVIVRKDAEDINDLPYGVFYGFDNWPYNAPEVRRCWHQAQATWREFRDFPPMEHLFNNGMMLIDDSMREVFEPTKTETYNHNADQDKPSHWKGMGLMNARLHALGIPVSHRPDLFGFSYLGIENNPSFLHVLWQEGSKQEAIRKYIEAVDA